MLNPVLQQVLLLVGMPLWARRMGRDQPNVLKRRLVERVAQLLTIIMLPPQPSPPQFNGVGASTLHASVTSICGLVTTCMLNLNTAVSQPSNISEIAAA